MALSRGLIGQVWAPSTRYKKRTNRLKAQTTEVAVPELALEVTSHGSIEEIGREAWDACNHGKGDGDNPFTSYDFLQSLEESGSAVASEGWRPCHFAARSRDSGNVVGVAPAYLKFHSWGEFVFDHSFAGAHARAKKGNYYPCAPLPECWKKGSLDEWLKGRLIFIFQEAPMLHSFHAVLRPKALGAPR